MSVPFRTLLERRLSRRGMLFGAAALAAGAGLPRSLRAEEARATPTFAPLPLGAATHVEVPAGYRTAPVVRWGDPLLRGAPAFDPTAMTGATQGGQLGFNCDFVAYLPLPYGSRSSSHGLLCVSTEYTTRRRMFANAGKVPTPTQCDVEMAAHGLNIMEVCRAKDGTWSVECGSAFNRRLTVRSPFVFEGPAAGHPRLRTSTDTAGRIVLGTLCNCSGGITPYGTWLQAEENFDEYFRGTPELAHEDLAEDWKLHTIRTKSHFRWEVHHARFDLDKEPHEANRFGWMVEIDPYAPTSQPVKRTALGRFKHEAASITQTRDGRLVVYMGDDERDQFVYKFVSKGRYDAKARKKNWGLLDEGTLYVAVFEEEGRGRWEPLVFGQGPLTPERGFTDQGDVLVRTRKAAALLGATPMDRPEDVEVHPETGAVYVALTNHTKRKAPDAAGANPRAPNPHGHILELRELEANPAATVFAWDVLLLGGEAAATTSTGAESVLSCPDNLAFGPDGHLWVATDGQPKRLQTVDGKRAHDSVYRVPLRGPDRGKPQRFLNAVPEAEVCGPAFTPDGRTFFCAIQHPGGASFAKPGPAFPDYDAKLPPRPSVIAVWRPDGERIGR